MLLVAVVVVDKSISVRNWGLFLQRPSLGRPEVEFVMSADSRLGAENPLDKVFIHERVLQDVV